LKDRFGSKTVLTPLKWDVCIAHDGPRSDIAPCLKSANSRLMHRSDGCLFDHLVSAGQNIWRDFETECLGGLRIHDKLEPRGLFDW
jgi:hypothetical protein